MKNSGRTRLTCIMNPEKSSLKLGMTLGIQDQQALNSPTLFNKLYEARGTTIFSLLPPLPLLEEKSRPSPFLEQERVQYIIFYYYVASSTSKQDGAIFLTQDYLHVPQKKFPGKRILNPLLNNLVWSRWFYISLVLFSEFMDFDSVLVHKHAKKGTRPIFNHHDLILGQ